MEQGNHGGTCPYCDSDTNHLNNHVRMSAFDSHGAQGVYPDDWDSGRRERLQQSEPSEPDDAGQRETPQDSTGGQQSGSGQSQGERTAETVQASEGDQSGPDYPTHTLVVTDSAADARQYDCSGCGDAVDYLAETCPDCDTELTWRVAA